MANTGVMENLPSTEDLFEDTKKCKKKKSKKLKKGKQDKTNSEETRSPQWLYNGSSWFQTQSTITTSKKKKRKNMRVKMELQDCSLLPRQDNRQEHAKQHKQCAETASHSEEKNEDRPIIQLPALEEQSVWKQEPMESVSRVSMTQEDRGRQKKVKKKVVFDLSPETIQAKKPRAAEWSAAAPCSKDALLLPSPVPCESESHSEQQWEEHCQASQGTAEDINSQDLFITQKTFSASYADFSSCDSTGEAIAVPESRHATSHHQPSQEPPPCKSTAEAATQTENFFTSTVLSRSLRFHQLCAATKSSQKPVDLSLPNKSSQKPVDLSLPNRRVETGLHCPLTGISSAGEISHQPEHITDTTSSEESDTLSRSKADLSQLKMVQTRLNESFFFKVKGEMDLPKPRTPLMKLAERVERKLKK